MTKENEVDCPKEQQCIDPLTLKKSCCKKGSIPKNIPSSDATNIGQICCKKNDTVYLDLIAFDQGSKEMLQLKDLDPVAQKVFKCCSPPKVVVFLNGRDGLALCCPKDKDEIYSDPHELNHRCSLLNQKKN